jgi:hypothetical protein
MPPHSRVQTRPSLTIGAWTGRIRASSVALLSACIAFFPALAHFGVATAERNASRSGNDPDRSVMAQAEGRRDGRLGVDSRLGDILHHPGFAEFGRLLLPWDGRSYDEDLRLRDIGSLLPYHSHVSPQLVVNALNHMIDDARSRVSQIQGSQSWLRARQRYECRRMGPRRHSVLGKVHAAKALAAARAVIGPLAALMA